MTLPTIDRSRLSRSAFAALNGVVEPTVKAGIGNPWPLGGGVVVIDTIGRKSGRTRSVPLVATRVGDVLVVSTVRSNSLWLRNIEAEPAVGVWLGGRRRTAQATVMRGPLNTVVLRLD